MVRSRIAGLIAIVLVGSSTAHGQTVSLRVLISNSSDIRVLNMPSLHEGVFAGYGSRTSDGAEVIVGGRLDDPMGTPLTVIAATGDPIPNRPELPFRTLRVPTVWNQGVYFSGHGRTSVDPADGLYAGSMVGESLGVLSDYFNGLGPWIEAPFAGAEGIAFVNREVSSGTGAGISLYTYDQQWIPVATYFQPMPGGAVLQSTSSSTVAIGGGEVAFSVRCTYLDSGAGFGVYSYNIASTQTGLIANWTTPIPGDGRLMEFVTAVDTDGQDVVFVASNGNVYFGGTAAVCVAGIDGSNLRVIARTGQPVPGMPGRTFRNLGRTAVDNGLVYFQGSYVDGFNERTSLFAHVNGVSIPVILYNQSIDGVTGNTPWFDPRGMSGPDVVVMCEAPTQNMGVSIYTLLHANIDVPAPCAADFTGDNAATVPDIFAFLALWFAGDAAADFDGTDGIGVPDIFAFLSAWFAGCS